MGQIFYISDTHLYHKGILRSEPQFSCIQAHDLAILTAWRDRVRPTDKVYIIGDLFGYHADPEMLDLLTGQLFLIKGNHEKEHWMRHFDPTRYFKEIYEDNAEIMDDGRLVRMCHYPDAALYPERENGYLLYGHIHQSMPHSREDWKQVCSKPRALNISADIAMRAGIYSPATLDEWVFFNEAWRSDLSNGN